MMTATRRYFDRRAQAFDRVYTRPRPLRRGPRHGRELAATVVRLRDARRTRRRLRPRPRRGGRPGGRRGVVRRDRPLAEDARARALASGDDQRVELLEAHFLDLDLNGAFDVVLALGLFDYVREPLRAAEWLRARCSSALVASFTRWDWAKGPPRRLEYALQRVPLRDYAAADAVDLLLRAGFARVERRAVRTARLSRCRRPSGERMRVALVQPPPRSEFDRHWARFPGSRDRLRRELAAGGGARGRAARRQAGVPRRSTRSSSACGRGSPISSASPA